MRSIITNVVLVLGSIIVSLLFAEVGVRLFAPQPMGGATLEYTHRGYMVNKSNGTVRFSVGGSNGIYHFMPPHLRGIRQPPESADRILVLGDSFTFGVGLSEEDTYVVRLQKKIDSVFGSGRISLLNAGIPGSGTAEQLAFLEDFGTEIAPRIVLVFVSVDDFNRAQRSFLYHLRGTANLKLDERSVPPGRFKKIIESDLYNFVIQHIQIAQLIRRAFFSIFFWSRSDFFFWSNPLKPWWQRLSATPPDQQRLARALFARMKAWCNSHGAKLAVINNGWRQYVWLPKLLASEGIAAFDAAPLVQSVIAHDMASYTIQGDGHPNAKGAAVTAEAVWPFIENFIRENANEAYTDGSQTSPISGRQRAGSMWPR